MKTINEFIFCLITKNQYLLIKFNIYKFLIKNQIKMQSEYTRESGNFLFLNF